MLEQQIQKKIINYLQDKGYTVVNLIKTNKSWIPDLMATKNWGCLWIEVKKPWGRLSKLQEFRIKKLRENGDTVLVPYWYDEFILQYNDYIWKHTNV